MKNERQLNNNKFINGLSILLATAPSKEIGISIDLQKHTYNCFDVRIAKGIDLLAGDGHHKPVKQRTFSRLTDIDIAGILMALRAYSSAKNIEIKVDVAEPNRQIGYSGLLESLFINNTGTATQGIFGKNSHVLIKTAKLAVTEAEIKDFILGMIKFASNVEKQAKSLFITGSIITKLYGVADLVKYLDTRIYQLTKRNGAGKIAVDINSSIMNVTTIHTAVQIRIHDKDIAESYIVNSYIGSVSDEYRKEVISSLVTLKHKLPLRVNATNIGKTYSIYPVQYVGEELANSLKARLVRDFNTLNLNFDIVNIKKERKLDLDVRLEKLSKLLMSHAAHNTDLENVKIFLNQDLSVNKTIFIFENKDVENLQIPMTLETKFDMANNLNYDKYLASMRLMMLLCKHSKSVTLIVNKSYDASRGTVYSSSTVSDLSTIKTHMLNSSLANLAEFYNSCIDAVRYTGVFVEMPKVWESDASGLSNSSFRRRITNNWASLYICRMLYKILVFNNVHTEPREYYELAIKECLTNSEVNAYLEAVSDDDKITFSVKEHELGVESIIGFKSVGITLYHSSTINSIYLTSKLLVFNSIGTGKIEITRCKVRDNGSGGCASGLIKDIKNVGECEMKEESKYNTISFVNNFKQVILGINVGNIGVDRLIDMLNLIPHTKLGGVCFVKNGDRYEVGVISKSSQYVYIDVISIDIAKALEELIKNSAMAQYTEFYHDGVISRKSRIDIGHFRSEVISTLESVKYTHCSNIDKIGVSTAKACMDLAIGMKLDMLLISKVRPVYLITTLDEITSADPVRVSVTIGIPEVPVVSIFNTYLSSFMAGVGVNHNQEDLYVLNDMVGTYEDILQYTQTVSKTKGAEEKGDSDCIKVSPHTSKMVNEKAVHEKLVNTIDSIHGELCSAFCMPILNDPFQETPAGCNVEYKPNANLQDVSGYINMWTESNDIGASKGPVKSPIKTTPETDVNPDMVVRNSLDIAIKLLEKLSTNLIVRVTSTNAIINTFKDMEAVIKNTDELYKLYLVNKDENVVLATTTHQGHVIPFAILPVPYPELLSIVEGNITTTIYDSAGCSTIATAIAAVKYLKIGRLMNVQALINSEPFKVGDCSNKTGVSYLYLNVINPISNIYTTVSVNHFWSIVEEILRILPEKIHPAAKNASQIVKPILTLTHVSDRRFNLSVAHLTHGSINIADIRFSEAAFRLPVKSKLGNTPIFVSSDTVTKWVLLKEVSDVFDIYDDVLVEKSVMEENKDEDVTEDETPKDFHRDMKKLLGSLTGIEVDGSPKCEEEIFNALMERFDTDGSLKEGINKICETIYDSVFNLNGNDAKTTTMPVPEDIVTVATVNIDPMESIAALRSDLDMLDKVSDRYVRWNLANSLGKNIINIFTTAASQGCSGFEIITQPNAITGLLLIGNDSAGRRVLLASFDKIALKSYTAFEEMIFNSTATAMYRNYIRHGKEVGVVSEIKFISQKEFSSTLTLKDMDNTGFKLSALQLRLASDAGYGNTIDTATHELFHQLAGIKNLAIINQTFETREGVIYATVNFTFLKDGKYDRDSSVYETEFCLYVTDKPDRY